MAAIPASSLPIRRVSPIALLARASRSPDSLRCAIPFPYGLEGRIGRPEVSLGDILHVLGKRPVRQVGDQIVLVRECSAHQPDI
jgi:hypothetical protein